MKVSIIVSSASILLSSVPSAFSIEVSLPAKSHWILPRSSTKSLLGALDGVSLGASDGVSDGTSDGALDGVLDGESDGTSDGVLDGALVGAFVGAFTSSILLSFDSYITTVVNLTSTIRSRSLISPSLAHSYADLPPSELMRTLTSTRILSSRSPSF